MFHIFEILMLICFGISWPISVYKTLKAKSANGKSCTFSLIIIAGYVFGIIGKLMQLPNNTFLFWLTFAAYIVNLLVVILDTSITYYYKYGKGSKK